MVSWERTHRAGVFQVKKKNREGRGKGEGERGDRGEHVFSIACAGRVCTAVCTHRTFLFLFFYEAMETTFFILSPDMKPFLLSPFFDCHGGKSSSSPCHICLGSVLSRAGYISGPFYVGRLAPPMEVSMSKKHIPRLSGRVIRK